MHVQQLQAVGLAALSLFCSWASAQQVHLDDGAFHPHSHHAGFQDTLLSALSSSNQHTTFIRLLQRSKAIPLLAHINATLFAPTDQAFAAWFDKNTPQSSVVRYQGWLGAEGTSEWLVGEEEIIAARVSAGYDEVDVRKRLDNQNWALRQHVLYHVLNYTITPSHFIASNQHSNITTETTLLFPLAEEPKLPPTPPSGPPWVPRGGEGMLGGHGQRLRLAKAGSPVGGIRGRIGVDYRGEGGASVWDGTGWERPKNVTENNGREDQVEGVRWVRNGVVIGIDAVLEPPPSIDEIIRTDPSLEYLSRLLPASSPFSPPMPADLATTANLTIFAPSNQAFDGVFDATERAYLEGAFGAEGVARILGGSVIRGIDDGRVGWTDNWGSKIAQAQAVTGLHLTIDTSRDGSIRVNGTQASAVDIFASNGVIHILPVLLLPEDFALLNSAEKVLLSLNATRFVSLLRSANLSSTYIGEQRRDEAWTILAPSDSVLDMTEKWGGQRTPLVSPPSAVDDRDITAKFIPARSDEVVPSVSPIAALLKYHILPGRLAPGDIRDGMLVSTELRTSLLAGARQRLAVEVSENLQIGEIGQGEIRFGGASVLGTPVKSGESIIYLVSSFISSPDDILQTAVSDLQLSTFVAAVYAAGLDRAVKRTPAVSYFIPRNRAFGALGLGMKYLLLPEGKDELRKIVRYHAITDILYSEDIEAGKHVYRTLEGGNVVLRRSRGKNGNLSLSSPTKWEGHDSGYALPSNGELRPSRVNHFDALTETGVIHTVDNVMIPADVSLTIHKLIRGSRHSTMADLMIRAGLGWILEGREPSSDEVSAATLQGLVSMADEAEGQEGPDAGSLAMPSYTLLVPTDKAFSRLNLTHYVNDKNALLELLKLHIIPTQPATPKRDVTKEAAEPPKDGQPLSLGDDLVYSTLLSGTSKYGNVAFRATGDNSYIVGIKGARGNIEETSARVGQTGRASVRWRKNARGGMTQPLYAGTEGANHEDGNDCLWHGGMALGGGVMVLDAVLIPYKPSWFSRWGWLLIMLVGVSFAILAAITSTAWWWMTKGKQDEYQALEGEEEE